MAGGEQYVEMLSGASGTGEVTCRQVEQTGGNIDISPLSQYVCVCVGVGVCVWVWMCGWVCAHVC